MTRHAIQDQPLGVSPRFFSSPSRSREGRTRSGRGGQSGRDRPEACPPLLRPFGPTLPEGRVMKDTKDKVTRQHQPLDAHPQS